MTAARDRHAADVGRNVRIRLDAFDRDLGSLFADFNLWLLVFVVVMCVVLWFMLARRRPDTRCRARSVRPPQKLSAWLSDWSPCRVHW